MKLPGFPSGPTVGGLEGAGVSVNEGCVGGISVRTISGGVVPVTIGNVIEGVSEPSPNSSGGVDDGVALATIVGEAVAVLAGFFVEVLVGSAVSVFVGLSVGCTVAVGMGGW